MTENVHDDPDATRLDDDVLSALRDGGPVDAVAQRRAVRAAISERSSTAADGGRSSLVVRWSRSVSAAAAAVALVVAGAVALFGGSDDEMLSAPLADSVATTRAVSAGERMVADAAVEATEGAAEGDVADSPTNTDVSVMAEAAEEPMASADEFAATELAESAITSDIDDAGELSASVDDDSVDDDSVADGSADDDMPLHALPVVDLDGFEALIDTALAALAADTRVTSDCVGVDEIAVSFARVNGREAVVIVGSDGISVRAVSVTGCDLLLSGGLP